MKAGWVCVRGGVLRARTPSPRVLAPRGPVRPLAFQPGKPATKAASLPRKTLGSRTSTVRILCRKPVTGFKKGDRRDCRAAAEHRASAVLGRGNCRARGESEPGVNAKGPGVERSGRAVDRRTAVRFLLVRTPWTSEPSYSPERHKLLKDCCKTIRNKVA